MQPAQEDDEQPPQEEPLEEPEDEEPEDLPMPKRDMSFSVLFDPHFSHATAGLEPYTSFSKSRPQAVQ